MVKGIFITYQKVLVQLGSDGVGFPFRDDKVSVNQYIPTPTHLSSHMQLPGWLPIIL